MLSNGSTAIDGLSGKAGSGSEDRRRRRAGTPAPDMERPFDVLHLVLAAVGEGDLDPPAHVLVDGVGDRDPARLGKALDAGGDVNAVAEDVARRR